MGFGSPLHWIVLVLVVVLLFGGGRISGLMGDVAKGIKSFKKGLADDEDETAASAKPAQRIEQRPVAAGEQAATRDEQKLDS
ncbi:Sec-independent protein translocase protein TatA/E [Sphingobium sp. SYK-6]|uniref:twin-arginine translocase TatA/TatE family subunit n=1 Tax=Sphingobium sp. (strain NBRC 103272 / SYK-6) TaxID=627192 RepID=UPI00022767DC|nr:twin-arginine translocase TatA/TatE family subunit [Sphingobium sp. SYK-6]BAK65252.1 Sec-independent protein translocase protein TatA/E [Sphingobium sp. SYK-6]